MRVANRLYSDPESARWETTEDGFLRCKARILRAGIMPYRREELADIPEGINKNDFQMLVSPGALMEKDALHSLEGAAVVIGGHEWVVPGNVQNTAGGHTAGAPRCNGSDLEIDLLITAPEAIQKIKSGELTDISAAYNAEAVFEPGEWRGAPYDARQENLRYNHVAIIPAGQGRGGSSIKILNQKGGAKMADSVRVKLANTGRFVNTDEDGARAIEEESAASKKSIEDSMGELQGKNEQLATLQQEIQAIKGELQAYKTALDELLSDEAVEKKAMAMAADQDTAGEIIENCPLTGENGNPMNEKERTEFKNSIKGLYGDALYTKVLRASGMAIDGMSSEAKVGAFRAFNQISKALPKAVSGAGVTASMVIQNTQVARIERTPLERLGYRREEK